MKKIKEELRTNSQKACEQSKRTNKYVIEYFCEKWSSPSGRIKAGRSLWKNGKCVETVDYKELHEFKKNNETMELKTAKEIRLMVKI